MKTLRKVLLTAFALCLAVCACSFVACKSGSGTGSGTGGGETPEHTHTASATYESNATEHWKKCTGEGCDKKLEEGSHIFGNWTESKAATCTEKGKEERACNICGYKEQRDTEPLGHVAKEEWKYDAKNHWHECVREGCDVKLEETAHDFKEWQTEKEPTCTEKGKGTSECKICGYKHDGEIDALDHDYEYSPAQDGENHVGVCKRDKSHVVTEKHVYGEELKFNEKGHYLTCTVCGYENVVKHEFTFNGETGALECACGYSQKAVEKTVYADEDNHYGFILNHNVDNVAAELGDQTIGEEFYEIDLGSEYKGEIWGFYYLDADLVKVTNENGLIRIPSEYFDGETVGDKEFKMLLVGEQACIVTIKVTFVTKIIETTDEFQNIFRDQKNKPAVYGYFVLGNDLDYEGKALPNHSGGLSYGMLWNCDGFKGTFDGRGHSIRNFNTANPFGLFVRISAKNGSVIKNLVFDDLVHEGGYGANIFGWATGYVRFDNITINVKKSVVAGGVTFEGTPNAGTTGVGFFFNLYADKNTYNNITINAEGQKIYSLLGSNVKLPESGVISCNNFVVNAKNVYYIGKIDGGDVISADTEINGLTLNLTSAGEVTKDVYEKEEGKVSFLIDLGVKNTTAELANQTIASGNATIAVGEGYGVLSSLMFNGNEVVGATYSEGVLTLPLATFTASDAGERVLTMTSESNGTEYDLSVHILLATKVIKTTKEFGSTFRSLKSAERAYGYFVLGNDLDYAKEDGTAGTFGVAYTVTCNGLCGTFDGRGFAIKNLDTDNREGMFVSIHATNKSVIKNLVFTDLVHSGNSRANIFGYLVAGTTFENITINVKSSVVAEGSTMTPADYSKEYYGFLTGYTMDRCTFKNVTINAKGQEIFSLFGYWIKQTTNVIDCDNVIVNAKKVHYLGRDWNNPLIDASTVVAGLTVNEGL